MAGKTSTKTSPEVLAVELTSSMVAESIIQISCAANKLLSSGLNKRAIIVLIHDALSTTKKVGKRDIEAVLTTASELDKIYLEPKKQG